MTCSIKNMYFTLHSHFRGLLFLHCLSMLHHRIQTQTIQWLLIRLMTTIILFPINHYLRQILILALAILALEAIAPSGCHLTFLQECLPHTVVLTHSGISHTHSPRILWAWALIDLMLLTLGHTIIQVLEIHLIIMH